MSATLLEASAGTGKTHRITEIVVELVVDHGLPIDAILVVTFTEAAAAELQGRVRSRLREAYASAGGEAAERLRRALEDFDRAAISTIHGFCQRVLARFAFESGTPFGTRLAGDAMDLVATVVRDFWTRLCADLTVPQFDALQGLLDRKEPFLLLDDVALKALADPDQPILPAGPASFAPPDRIDHASVSDWFVRIRRCLADEVRAEVPRRLQLAGSRTYDQLLTRLRDALRAEATREGLLTALRGTWKAALVDEFQDTDPVQWEIFRTVFGDGRLWLVGDPKQAIYGFRGADLHTYLTARGEVTVGQRLGKNWRSDERLVRAVDHLLRRPGLGDTFADPRVEPEPIEATHAERRLHGDPDAALEIRLVPPALSRGRLTRWWCEDELPDVVARDVATALAAGWEITRRDGVRTRVGPGDCAVLVRTNEQAAKVQLALRGHRVPSVLRDGASVLSSPECESLQVVLAAVLEPWRTGAIGRALLEPAFGLSLGDLAALWQDDDAWSARVEDFRRWYALWASQGFVTMFRALLDEGGVVPRLLELPDGARRVTNWLHLGELCHAEVTRRNRGPDALLAWLAAGGPGVEEEQRGLRLESDDDAVQVVTVHKSKGLEYGLVWCPFLWGGAWTSHKDQVNLRFHDGERRVLDLRAPEDPEKKQRLLDARQHALAEELRLAYVALTRARHRAVVYWSQVQDQGGSALAWLLHRTPGTTKLAGLAGRMDSLGWGDVEREVKQLAAGSGGTIGVSAVAAIGGPPVAWHPGGSPDLAAAPLARTRAYDVLWRRGSFSSLVAGASAHVEPDEHEDIEVSPDPVAAGLVPLHDFPRGAAVGQWVHEALEHVDFRRPEQLLPELTDRAPVHGMDAAQAPRLADALARVLETPLDPAVPGLRLAAIPPEQRLAELDFHLPIAGGFAAGGASVTPDRLADVFARHGHAAYADRVRALAFPRLHGFLYGLIDLLFVHEGRWYVADHKTNHLGPTFAHYGPDALAEAMADHHYVLQATLYSVAVRRWLRRRVRGWTDDRFAGAAYLFLRGMTPETGAAYGVWRWTPPAALLDDLDELFGPARRP
jgi:exodeoxyribonuclease V beta subunit